MNAIGDKAAIAGIGQTPFSQASAAAPRGITDDPCP
jgi:hypothetical protein